MATLLNLVAALLFTLIVSSSHAEELKDKNNSSETVVDFEKAFPDQLVLATFEDVTTCNLDNEFKQQCEDEYGESFDSYNITYCLYLGCCYFDNSDVEDSVRCYKSLPVLGRSRTSQGGYYVIGNKPVQGQGYGYPSNTIPGPVPVDGRHYATARPTILVRKPTALINRFQWRDYTFSFFKIGRTYDEALQSCQKESSPSMPSTLLEISNKLVSDFITDKIRSWEKEIVHSGVCSECMGYWVGGNDKTTEGRWKWESGININLPGQGGYQNWYKSGSYQEPNGANGKDCLTVAATDKITTYQGTIGKWFDGDCSARRYYVCMKGATVKSSVFNTGTVICIPGTCLNGGQCFPFSPTGGFECRCVDGYTGQRCEISPNRPTIPPTRVIPTTSCCAVPSYIRKPCGFPGIPGNLCKNRYICCYNELTRSCYHRALGCRGPTRTTTTVQPPTTTPTPTVARYAYWLKWSGWSKCSRTCGQGRWTRIRGCMGGMPGQAGCLGESTQSAGCTQETCPVPTWTAWVQWSDCSVSCGTGLSFRVRKCQVNGKPASSCPGTNREDRQCGRPCVAWAQWASWGKCSVTCGSGFHSRTRVCTGNGNCPGEPKEEKSCTLAPCPIGIWSSWTVLQQCDATCGGGTTVRIRVCRGSGCPGVSRIILQCNTQACIGWTSWSQYGACTRTCGSGTMTRTRSCSGGRPGQPGCIGDSTMVNVCNPLPCSNWTPWSNVGPCSATCDGGVVRRTRVCKDGSCTGPSNSTVACGTVPCVYWSAWSSYGQCSVTCGTGVRMRTRECQGGIRGDKGCEGATQLSMPCTAPNPICVKTTWSQWTEAGECSAKCGAGQRRRIRTCIGGVVGQVGCQGPMTDFISCNVKPCGKWEAWGRWSRCSVSCGQGTRYRLRSCSNGRAGSPGCLGSRLQTERCNQSPCTEVISWSSWSEWSGCSATCNFGTRSRFRTCQKSTGEISIGGCTGNATMVEECRASVACPRDSTLWSQWSSTGCSATCGTGFTMKRRTCIGGSAGVGNCQGKALEVVQCVADIIRCVVPEWAEWGVWTSCSVTCGEGRYSRTRICMHGTIGGKGCSPANDAVEVADCTASVKTCAYYTEWSEYSKCSLTCGGGRQTRTRTCIGGNDCVGESSQSITCNNQECATWGSWESWSQCSKDCGTGVAKRIRSCKGGDVGAPGCIGRDTEEKSCNTLSCPTWSSWSDYSECTEDCGGGKTTRTRTCLNGDIGQIGCQGESEDTRDCNTSPCDAWGEWRSWSSCSADCGSGITIRSRTCLFGIAGVGRCVGESEERDTCNKDPCASWGEWIPGECSVTCGEGVRTLRRECIDGIAGISEGCLGESDIDEDCNAGVCQYWGEWDMWSACSATCGGGEMRRVRGCVNGRPGVDRCLGPEEETKLCGSKICESWSGWGLWGECSATCGGGQSLRGRECMHGNAGDIGCRGDDLEVQYCATQGCAFWSNWRDWDDCSVTCGEGASTRKRVCIGGNEGEVGCEGEDEDAKVCGEKLCEFWADWQSWSSCSKTCGSGVMSRLRLCTNGDAGDSGCLGPFREEDACNTQSCVTCNAWGEWSACSVTCGGGISTRIRSCSGCDPETDDCQEDEVFSCAEIVCPEWSMWGEWSDCSVTCGDGAHNRNRTCIKEDGDTGECMGEASNTEFCNERPCPEWTTWGDWTECTRSCGGGTSIRGRSCIGSIDKNNECDGPTLETERCNSMVCPTWTTWGEWSPCNVTCGHGGQIRVRACAGIPEGPEDCAGDSMETQLCTMQECIGWTDWGSWSDCSVTCGVGISRRARLCGSEIFGIDCVGDSFEEKECSDKLCATWSEWGVWSTCTASCGGGENIRFRLCIDGEAGVDCLGDAVESELCNNDPCPKWTSWGDWSDCSSSCGPGNTMRNRICQNGLAGEHCPGDSFETNECVDKECPVWGEWSLWSACSASCGDGETTRKRVCINGEPGFECPGESIERNDCTSEICVFWAEWTEWSSCSATCGGGERKRQRLCVDGVAGEAGCEGPDEVIEMCGGSSAEECPAWSTWSVWSVCNAPCGGGAKTRTRICVNAHVGDGCGEGDYTDEMICNFQSCASWAAWSAWTTCSATCGEGQSQRTRECTNGVAGEEGCDVVDGIGDTEQELCFQQACPSWGEWSFWSTCTKTCDGGLKERTRECYNGLVGEPGCETSNNPGDYQLESCEQQLCPQFSDWTQWSACNASCDGEGVRSHTRICLNGKIGQFGCEGPVSEDQDCTGEKCAFWSTWSEYSDCTQSCGGGIQTRGRLCVGGEVRTPGCIGGDSEEIACNEQTCTAWSLWGSWSSCSQSCGEAEKSRFRICMNGEMGDPGCQNGSSVDTDACPLVECPSCIRDWEETGMINGNVTCTNGSEINSVCIFQCNDGFEPFGDPAIICESNGKTQWSSNPPRCVGRCSDLADIVFIIDSSSSIGKENFAIVRNFLKDVASGLAIGPDAAQIGAIRYNKNVHHLWDLKDYSTLEELSDAIDAIPYGGTGTHTGQAMTYAHNNTFTAAAGRRVGVPKIAVVITDGVSFDNVSGPANLLKSDGAFVIAVGIGKAKEEQIYEISSDPNNEFSTIVDDFEALPASVAKITNQIKLCKELQPSTRNEGCPPQALADILLIVDRSSSIGRRNFGVMKDFIKDLISEFNIGLASAMFGLILYNREVSSYFQLDDFEETSAILAAIDRMPYSGMGTRTGSALEFAATNGLSVGREGIPKIAIVITDGKSQDEVTAGAAALKKKAEVIAIGIEGAVFTELVEIASDKSDVFTTNFEQLADTLDQVKNAICNAEKKSSSIVI